MAVSERIPLREITAVEVESESLRGSSLSRRSLVKHTSSRVFASFPLSSSSSSSSANFVYPYIHIYFSCLNWIITGATTCNAPKSSLSNERARSRDSSSVGNASVLSPSGCQTTEKETRINDELLWLSTAREKFCLYKGGA